MQNNEIEFCQCADKDSKGVCGPFSNDFGYWLKCGSCGKVIEDSFEYFNHYDGEDHLESEMV